VPDTLPIGTIVRISNLRTTRAAFVASAGAAAIGATLADIPPALAQTSVSQTPNDLETPIASLNTPVTSNDLHYVSSRYGPPLPTPDLGLWRLAVNGAVANPLNLSIFELRTEFEAVDVTAVCQSPANGCSLFSPHVPGAQWTYGGVGNARWTGVRLADVLDRAQVDPNTLFLMTSGADLPRINPNAPPYVRTLPIDKALDAHTILAYDMNGAALPMLHGAPLRLVAPGWYGHHWMKWLTNLEARVSGLPEDAGFWVAVAYRMPNAPATPGVPVLPQDTHVITQMNVKSEIFVPLDGAIVRAGAPLFVQGVAWSGVPTIRLVEISIDGGPWSPAELQDDPRPYAWRHFTYPFTPSVGTHLIAARATDEAGEIQPLTGIWNPGGYMNNAVMRVTITAA
jgi:DMSO/TMAO reductase YedYZ molybdopterin-dependent catalytic subunit